MTIIAFVGLALLWAAVLLPSWLRDLTEHGGAKRDTVDVFQRQLTILGKTGPTTYEPANRLDREAAPLGSTLETARRAETPVEARTPKSGFDAGRRRREILITLGGTALVTLTVLLFARTMPILALHVAADLTLAGYVLLLTRHRRLEIERAAKVRYLPPRGVVLEPALEPALLRRSGS